jgi:hypothetical protein
MKGLRYIIIAFLTAVTLTMGAEPGLARKSGFGGGHRGGHGGYHGGQRGGHRGHYGYRGGHRGNYGYRGGHRGNYGYRSGHYYKHRYGYGYYRPYYNSFAYYWPYLIPPLVFGSLFYYQYSRPVYYPTYPNPVNQQVIISPQAQAPAETPQTQVVPQEQSGTYQIIVKDRYGNPQTVNVPRGKAVTITEGENGELQINFEEQPSSQQAIPQGNTIAENYQNNSAGYGSGIPLKQTDAFGMGW